MDAVFISTNQHERRTRLLFLLVVALVVVLRLRTCQKSFGTICTSHWLISYALRSFVGGMHRVNKRTYLGCGFPIRVGHNFNNSISSSFNPSHPHVLPPHHTHFTTLSHSLGDKDDSRSYLASTAKARNQHQIRGKVEWTLLTRQVKLYLGKVYSWKDGVCIDRSTKTLQRFTLPTRSPSSTMRLV
jgi:hypothetical protein